MHPSHRCAALVGTIVIGLVSACSSQRGHTPADGPVAIGGGPVGIWEIAGSDARGSYAGQIEIIADGSQLRFTRVIQYDHVAVEDGRALWWVWHGMIAQPTDAELDATFALEKADFISVRDALARTDSDKTPATAAGTFAPVAGGWSGSWSGDGIDGAETWIGLRPSSAMPIFALDKTLVPAHAPPDASKRATLFATFASFHQLPDVAPYASDPRFQAAVHYFDIDHTDYAFYQAHPDALRVVDKVIDAISLQETLARANSFKWTLAGKAAYFDADMPRFIDATAHMAGNSIFGTLLVPSGDSALWTSTWVASQAYRYLVTGDASVLDRLAPSVDAIDTLVDIVRATGDTTNFARTLQPHGLTTWSNWIQGTGPYADLDWMPGGNNDMFKGLLYANLTGYLALCDPPTGHNATCAHIVQTVRYMADDLAITQSDGSNKLVALWLAAYVTADTGYLGRAATEWLLQATAVKNGNAMIYDNGIADWSGTHLNFVQFVMMHILESKVDLGFLGEPPDSDIRAGVDTCKSYFHAQHMATWSLAFAELGSAADAAAADETRWQLREMPAPKTRAVIDHRVNADFVMSPYPFEPWQQVWTTTDRTQSLVSYPLFKRTPTTYAWGDDPLEYRADTSREDHPGMDYLHVYWLGRWLGVLSSTE